MSDKFLTKEELEDLTGLTQGAAQIRWLLKRGVTHYVRADGRPRVPVDKDGNPVSIIKAPPPQAISERPAPPLLPTPDQFLPVLSMPQLRQLPTSAELGSGIYFLWRDDSLLYIGKSRNVSQRLVSHEYAREYGHLRTGRTNIIPFNRQTCLIVSHGWLIPDGIDEVLKPIERAYIAHFAPPYNCPYPNPGT